MRLEKQSPCKVNLLLNILGKRTDGFHELETVMQPVPIYDLITFETCANGIHLTSSDARLPTDSKNLIYRAAEIFFAAAEITSGIRIRLEKKIPLAAGLGGGSGNAATTLLALNELFRFPLLKSELEKLAASIGSDIPFFLQPFPALATGRGENIQPLEPFAALSGCYIFIVHPGFGISTPWAYQQLANFPHALNGQPGRAQKLISLLQQNSAVEAAKGFYNSLEAPALPKYPLLTLFQEFFRENGAIATLMSGSGSSTFAIVKNGQEAVILQEKFNEKFGLTCWMATVPLNEQA